MDRKNIVISCGPIPARLDSVKFITNKFKGGLAFKTAEMLIDTDKYDMTIIVWDGTTIPEKYLECPHYYANKHVHLVKVKDVIDYCNWFKENATNYDAFILAAAVANLMPSNPWEGKFPSHNYKVGEKFNIEFEIAPRAIDIIKQINPRACLIGYKLFDGSYEELINAARLTQAESKANAIFANTPKTAKTEKFMETADNSVVRCSFDEHVDWIQKLIESHYFKTEVEPLTDKQKKDANVREAIAVVKMYEKTFNGFGTVAVPIPNHGNWFATTSRGHKGDPVVVYDVDFENHIVKASDKATLNAPTLFAALNGRTDVIVVHRHNDDPLFKDTEADAELKAYTFPGTVEEVEAIKEVLDKHKKSNNVRILLYEHGDLSILPISDPDWNEYRNQFPERYFSQAVTVSSGDGETLELGAGKTSSAKYVYDKYVKCENAINLTEKELFQKHYNFVYANNAINYFGKLIISKILKCTDSFMANTFLNAPDEKVTDKEAVITDKSIVHHNLRLNDDSLVRHVFYAYSEEEYKELGLDVTRYGKNSAYISKNCSKLLLPGDDTVMAPNDVGITVETKCLIMDLGTGTINVPLKKAE